MQNSKCKMKTSQSAKCKMQNPDPKESSLFTLHCSFCILHFAFFILHFAFLHSHFAFCIFHFAFPSSAISFGRNSGRACLPALASNSPRLDTSNRWCRAFT